VDNGANVPLNDAGQRWIVSGVIFFFLLVRPTLLHEIDVVNL
jgi:hypothetical protein